MKAKLITKVIRIPMEQYWAGGMYRVGASRTTESVQEFEFDLATKGGE